MEALRLLAPTRPCSYLPQESAALEYRFFLGLDAAQYATLVERGWRRFGEQVFRPACPTCRQCRPLRVDVRRFRPSKSQRRCVRRNCDVEVRIQPPSLSDEHLKLYDAYHADMSRRRGWPFHRISAAEYVQSFLVGDQPRSMHDGADLYGLPRPSAPAADQESERFAREFLYFRGDRLVGVGLVDLLPNALSSVYFFHDPQWRPSGPGTFSILKEIEFARSTGRSYHYLGYWIAQNPSMAYKARFRPHELLEGWPRDDEPPCWRPAED